jgi:hypothetical protein
MGVDGAPLDAVQRRRPVLSGASNPIAATLTLRFSVIVSRRWDGLWFQRCCFGVDPATDVWCCAACTTLRTMWSLVSVK